MNRRNFFKIVTGFVAGIFIGSTKAKGNGTIDDVYVFDKTDKEISRMCNTMEPTAIELDAQRITAYSRFPAYILHGDGSIERIPFKDFYK